MKAYTVVLSPDLETGGYSVSCPALPGATSQGEDRLEALRNIKEAMELWLEVSFDGGAQPVEETPELVADELAFVLGWKAEEGWPLLVETATVFVAEAVAA